MVEFQLEIVEIFFLEGTEVELPKFQVERSQSRRCWTWRRVRVRVWSRSRSRTRSWKEAIDFFQIRAGRRAGLRRFCSEQEYFACDLLLLVVQTIMYAHERRWWGNILLCILKFVTVRNANAMPMLGDIDRRM
jgi:hypothetical protein